jgi:hypothetical protein
MSRQENFGKGHQDAKKYPECEHCGVADEHVKETDVEPWGEYSMSAHVHPEHADDYVKHFERNAEETGEKRDILRDVHAPEYSADDW